ncbi:hypothetical protein HPP92_023455 [Vanilla planifolia]|uniref:Uncharacterized protein n=1 Tax=Vanilla planifolia TaxID=51239 RepID=A0A835UG26_VANPL|nr:hypothetical protein HPP92_023455 [Vanilla planifolia]
MEPRNSYSSQVLPVPKHSEKFTCGGPTCGLYNSNDSSVDAKERSTSVKKLFIACLLCFIFMCIEIVGGIKANSLAILADAAHLLTDLAAFAISLFSIWASGWDATPRHSYGFYGVEILGTLLSIMLIWLFTGIIAYEALLRLIHGTSEVHGVLMFAISGFGCLINIIVTIFLGHNHSHGGHGHGHGHNHNHNHDHNAIGHQHNHGHDEECDQSYSINISIEDDNARLTQRKRQNINIHSAYLHALGDSIQSLGVMVGGAIIWRKPEWKVVDLICTLLFSLVVLVTTINILRKLLSVLMESTPKEIDTTKLEKDLCEIQGVVEVHELHIWAITIDKVLLACHVTIT